MKLWCERCGAVEAIPDVIQEPHFEVDTREYETTGVLRCPECGAVLYEDPGTCELCGEWCAPDVELCEDCKGVIRTRIATMAADLGVTVSIMEEALADYLAEE